MSLPTDNQFFRWVWHFNALAIAIGSILIIATAAYALIDQFHYRMRDLIITDNVAVGDQSITREIYTIGRPETVSGTNWVTMPLIRDQIRGVSSFSKSSQDNQMNTYFIDANSGKGHWLFPDHHTLINSTVWLTNATAIKEEIKATGALYVVVQKDSNADGLLTDADTQTVFYSGFDGNGVKTILENVTKIIAMSQTSADRAIVLYENDKQNSVNVYNAVDMTLLSSSVIPQL